MLIRLLRTYLRPYARQVAVVVALLVVQTAGNLYLPNLNADIINNGVVKGDLHYIWTTGGVMLAITLVLGVVAIVAVYWASRVVDGRRRGHPRRGVRARAGLLRARDEPLRDAVADHPQHQRHPADPDVPADGADADGHRPDHVRRRRDPGDPRGRGAVARCSWSPCR